MKKTFSNKVKATVSAFSLAIALTVFPATSAHALGWGWPSDEPRTVHVYVDGTRAFQYSVAVAVESTVVLVLLVTACVLCTKRKNPKGSDGSGKKGEDHEK